MVKYCWQIQGKRRLRKWFAIWSEVCFVDKMLVVEGWQ